VRTGDLRSSNPTHKSFSCFLRFNDQNGDRIYDNKFQCFINNDLKDETISVEEDTVAKMAQELFAQK
jgi:hypothetical protein